MNRLLEIGFELAGHWLLDGEKLRCELTRHAAQRNILYAFVCDGEVKYVGKTVGPLAARMSGYRSPAKSQTTNAQSQTHSSGISEPWHRKTQDGRWGEVSSTPAKGQVLIFKHAAAPGRLLFPGN